MAETKSQIDKLKQQREQLSAKIQKLEAAEKAREKKKDTRRKILIGAYYLDKARKEGSVDVLNQEMANYLKRQSDRALFDLVDEEGTA